MDARISTSIMITKQIEQLRARRDADKFKSVGDALALQSAERARQKLIDSTRPFTIVPAHSTTD